MTKIHRITDDKMHYTNFRREKKNKKTYISISMCRFFKVTLTKLTKKCTIDWMLCITYLKLSLPL
jgi:hypothetical protein